MILGTGGVSRQSPLYNESGKKSFLISHDVIQALGIIKDLLSQDEAERKRKKKHKKQWGKFLKEAAETLS